MSLRIHNDHNRFNEIVMGRIKQNLKDYIKNTEWIAKRGNEKFSISIPQLDLPQFRFGSKSQGGVGQGSGKEGDPLFSKEKQERGHAGQSKAAEHLLEVEVTLKELADMLGAGLSLPQIKAKGSKQLQVERLKYSGVHSVGPQALRHFKHTFKNALRRQIAMGNYDPKCPIIVPIREDVRYRSFKEVKQPHANALIIYMMDVSGSMGEEQKEIVRIESFWIDTWLKYNYQGIESRYIIHDAAAKEVQRETFFHTRESGGTMISSAYRLCAEILDKHYNCDEWNVYIFHFSDGDNWSVDDTRLCVGILRERILSKVNQFSYGQVESPYGSGQFIKDLRENLYGYGQVVLSEIKRKEDIYLSIKEFLGQGR